MPAAAARRTLSVLAAALAVTLSATVHAQPDPAFAAHLMKERDYFRAITVFKELVFLEKDEARRAQYTYQIGQAYRLARRYELSNEVFVRLLAEQPKDPGLVSRIHLQVGYSAMGMGIPGQAIPRLQQARSLGQCARAELGLGWAALEVHQVLSAASHFANAAAASEPVVAKLGGQLQRATVELDQLPSRSPALAATLSALLPGAGQAYTGHWVDGVQAFGFVGVFGLSSYLAWRYEHDHHGPYVFTPIAIGITSLFYFANVLGAERTARFFNQRQREMFLGGLRHQVLAIEF